MSVTINDNQSCLYWAGDHYHQISCNQKLENAAIITLESARLVHFKKITQPDTITIYAKGYVWYAKLNKIVEFYTADGDHPLHPEYRLRPITDYMINKYIKQATPNQ